MTEKRTLIGNSLAMIVNRLVQSISTFVLTATIAHALGAYALGQYLLAFSYYFIFVNIASQALKTLFTRALARNPQDTSIYLVNGSWLQFLLSVVAYVVLVIVVFAMPYSADTSTVCYIMGLAIIPFALSNITEAIFQAQEKMHLIAFSTVPIYILRLLVMLGALTFNLGVSWLAGILVLSEVLILIIQWLLLSRLVELKWRIRENFIWDTIQDVRTLFAIEGVTVISSKIEVLLLSLLGSELLVGLNGGITQLLQPFLIIANSVAVAIFPAMSKASEEGVEKQRQITQYFIEILLAIALPLLLGLIFLGKDLLIFVYGSDFAVADVALYINSFALLLLPFNRALSSLLVARGFEVVNLRQVISNVPVGFLIGTFLIAQYKLVGAAMTDVVMAAFACSQYVYAVYHRLFSLNLWQIFRRPLLISILMTPVFVGLANVKLHFLLTLLTATFSYCLLVILLGAYGLGGFRSMYTKLLSKK